MTRKYIPATVNGRQPIIAIDFDGVIHPYGQGWKGPGVFAPPHPQASPCIKALKANGYIILIYTCRGENDNIAEYLDEHNIPYDYINEHHGLSKPNKTFNGNPTKVAADIYVDDRGLRFNGDWYATIQEIESYFLWYERKDSKSKHPDAVGVASIQESMLDRAMTHIECGSIPYVKTLIKKSADPNETKELEAVLSALEGITGLMQTH